jgi:predicted TIM-barrel fold metal-dependent hydrolase
MSRVIDADGHVLMEAADGWLDYFDASDADHMQRLILDNRKHWYARAGNTPEVAQQMIRDRCKGAGGWDPKVRLRVMDEEGIDLAVLFATELGLSLDAYGPGVCRGYNDWLAEFCATDHERLRGIALLPLADIDAACAELRRCVEQHRFVGFFMKGSVENRTCDASHFDPLYAEAERLGVPLLIHIPHGVKAVLEDQFGYDFLRSHVMHPVAGMLACVDAVLGGIFERFDALRVGIMEAQVGWLPWLVSRMDEQHDEYTTRPGFTTPLRRDPSSYFDGGRIFFSCDADERYLGFAANEALTEHTRGEDLILWATDYPHSDAIYPGAVSALSERDDLDAGQKEKILGGNAARLFSL